MLLGVLSQRLLDCAWWGRGVRGCARACVSVRRCVQEGLFRVCGDERVVVWGLRKHSGHARPRGKRASVSICSRSCPESAPANFSEAYVDKLCGHINGALCGVALGRAFGAA